MREIGDEDVSSTTLSTGESEREEHGCSEARTRHRHPSGQRKKKRKEMKFANNPLAFRNLQKQCKQAPGLCFSGSVLDSETCKQVQRSLYLK